MQAGFIKSSSGGYLLASALAYTYLPLSSIPTLVDHYHPVVNKYQLVHLNTGHTPTQQTADLKGAFSPPQGLTACRCSKSSALNRQYGFRRRLIRFTFNSYL